MAILIPVVIAETALDWGGRGTAHVNWSVEGGGLCFRDRILSEYVDVGAGRCTLIYTPASGESEIPNNV